MDVYILPSLGSSEFNPQGSCTCDPRALPLLIATGAQELHLERKGGELGSAGATW